MRPLRRTTAARQAPARVWSGCAPARPDSGRGDGNGRGHGRGDRRHCPLRRLRQERAHPLRQPGGAARQAVPRPVPERGRHLHGLFDKIKVAGPPSSSARSTDPADRRRVRAPGRRQRQRAGRGTGLRSAGRSRVCRGARMVGRRSLAGDPAELARPPHGRISSLPAAGEGPARSSNYRNRVRPWLLRAPTRPPHPLPSSASTWARPAPRPRWLSWAAPCAGRRLPAHGRQPSGSGGGSGRRAARDERRSRGGHRRHRLGPRRAATVARAAYPKIGGRLCVQNEIVAHATAALATTRRRQQPVDHRDRRPGRQVHQRAQRPRRRLGHEPGVQCRHRFVPGGAAEAFGVHDIAEFGELAAGSTRPPDLGQTCTVFVGDVAVEALSQGYSREDVFAGLQFSVVRNYRSESWVSDGSRNASCSRASRPAAPRCAHAGGCHGTTVCVPPTPRHGRYRHRLAGGRGVGSGTPEETAGAPLDLERLLRARVRERGVPLRDRSCGNMCRIESATVDLDGEARTVVSGGTCPSTTSPCCRKLPRARRGRSMSVRSCWRACSARSVFGRPVPTDVSGRPTRRHGWRRVDPMSAGRSSAFRTVTTDRCAAVLPRVLHGTWARVQVIRSTRASLADGDAAARRPDPARRSRSRTR